MEKKKKINVPEADLPTKPLTLTEVREAAHKRTSLINKEFAEGFKFLEKYPRSVTFFGSARFSEDNVHYKKAQSLAKKISKELGYSITTGGGPGIMEAANRGAFEAGGESLGLTIKLPHEQAMNPYITDNIDFYYFFSRKVCLSFGAEAYVFFPGGFGTMDEFFEIICLVQTHKIEKVPVILVGQEYWGDLNKFIEKNLVENKTVAEKDTELYTITDDEEKIIEMIKKAPVRNGVRFSNPKETVLD